jgi:hypothetical protein
MVGPVVAKRAAGTSMDEHPVRTLASRGMSIRFKITNRLLTEVRRDLCRRHEFALERVGFISANVTASSGNLCILAQEYRAVDDQDYLNDLSVGAMLGSEAIRKALQWAMTGNVAIFHVHAHRGYGVPCFSHVDIREQIKLVGNFFQVAPKRPHGALVLSQDSAFGNVQLRADSLFEAIDEFVEVGSPVRIWRMQ